MNQSHINNEDPRLAEMLAVIFRFAAGDLTARGTISEDDSALDGVMAGINILGEELEAYVAENKQVHQELSESEALLRSIFDSVQDGIILADAQTRQFRMVNASFCRMLGYNRDELLNLGMEGIHPEEDIANVIRQFERMAKGEIGLALNLPIKRKDGTVFYADVNSGPMMFNGATCLVGVFRDISTRKLAEEQIRRLNKSLEEKVQQLLEVQDELMRKEKLSILGQLSGSVGHELRNPLGVMSNAVYFLKMVLADADDTTKEYLDIIKKEIDNSLRIITDLLDFARTKAPQAQAVTARELIDEGLGRCVIPENIDLQTEIPDNLPLLRVDPQQMGQVLQNLIMNAVQAMADGGALRVAARLVGAIHESPRQNMKQETADFIAISVTDTGEGIAPENMNKLFQPLFTTKPKGIGLGLVVCKNVVEANGGHIEVQSEAGKGSVFSVILPADQN